MTRAVLVLTEHGDQKMLGLSLRKRLILNTAQGGIKEIWLFSPEANRVENALLELSSDYRILKKEIRLKILNPESLPSEFSRSQTEEPILVMRDDLVLDPLLFPTLFEKARSLSSEQVSLVLETGSGRLEPVSGVLVVKPIWLVEAIGKVISDENLEKPFKDEVSNPAGLIVSARFGLRVYDRQSFRRAEKALLQTARKPQDGWVARVINRRISLFLTRYLVGLGIHPVAISLVTFTLGLASVFCIGFGRQLMVPGAILFELASIIDGCDGENARLTHRVTRLGGLLDVTGDAVTFVSFFAALPLGLYRTTDQKFWLYLGAFTLASMIAFYLQLFRFARQTGIGRNIQLVVKEVEASINRPEFQRPFDRAAARIAFIYRRDFFSMAAFILIVLGQARALMFIVAVAAFLEAAYFRSYSRRWTAFTEVERKS